MANLSAFAATKNTGDQLLPSDANALNVGMQAALCRAGTTAMTANTTLQGGGFGLVLDASDNASSFIGISLGAADMVVLNLGAGITSFTANKIKFTGSSYPQLTSRTENRIQRAPSTYNTNFAFDTATKLYLCSVAAGQVYIPLSNSVDGGVLTAVRFYVKAGFGAAWGAVAPGVLPSFQVWKVDSTGTLTGALGTGTVFDTFGSQAAFNAMHTVDITGLSETIDNSAPSTYSLQVTGPSGANFVASAYGLIGVRCSYTVTNLTPGG